MRAIGLVVVAACGASAPPPTPAPPPPPVIATPPPVAPDAAVPQVAIPDSPAGDTLRAFLDAFNSGDNGQLQAFASKHKAPMIPPDFYAQTGGFELLSVRDSDPLLVRFVVKDKRGPHTGVGWLRVKDTAPTEVVVLDVLALEPGQTPDDLDIRVDAAARGKLLDEIAATLDADYVYPDLAKKMTKALREHEQKGDYDALDDGYALAPKLTEDLLAVGHDRHMHLEYTPGKIPERAGGEPSDEDKRQFREQMERINCGFAKTERLDGNIGYVKLDMFGDEEVCGPKATAALASLGDIDALILDIRDNGGGQPAMVSYVVSYLFAKKTHVNDLYERKSNKTTEYWTTDVPGTKFVTQPVYVLTSSRTFSGAEELAYDLKNLKRATIVGETTGGGAHPVEMARLDDHFALSVPVARAISPVTKTDWEGKGVEPDVKVPADQALDTARKLAADKLKKH